MCSFNKLSGCSKSHHSLIAQFKLHPNFLYAITKGMTSSFVLFQFYSKLVAIECLSGKD